MGRDYIGKSGNSFSINVAGAELLDKITFGLFEKIGCFPKTKEDSLLVTRVLRNRIRLNKYYLPFWKEIYDVEKFSDNEADWMEDIAEFFEISNGLDLEEMG